MTTAYPNLSPSTRTTAGGCSNVPNDVDAGASSAVGEPALHLDELVPRVRARLFLPASITDRQIRADLGRIAARSSRQDRWRTAFGSHVAAALMARGADLNTALNILLGLIPPPRL